MVQSDLALLCISDWKWLIIEHGTDDLGAILCGWPRPVDKPHDGNAAFCQITLDLVLYSSMQWTKLATVGVTYRELRGRTPTFYLEIYPVEVPLDM